MTEAIDVPLFDVPAGIRRGSTYAATCRQQGQRGHWTAEALASRPHLAEVVPTCNRMFGHEGPHRYYDRRAAVCAEWR